MNSNSSNAANEINVTPSMDDRRSKSPHNSSSITSSRLRRHSLDYILTDGIRVCDVERLYQHQNEIFDRCSCVRTITFGSPSIVGGGGGGDDSAAIRNEDIIFIRIDPLTFEPANALMEIKHFIVRSAAILINDRLKRMGSMNVRDKLFSDNVTTLVLIHRPTGRLLAVLTYDFRPIENLGELIFLVVRPKYQRRGYGSMLLSIMSKIIIPNCAEYAVHADLGAIEFYRRIGFVQEMNTKEIQRLERFMGQYTGSILMRVNRTTMIEKLRNLTLTSVELITLDDIQPTRSHCPIHIGLKSTTLQHHPGENNNNNNNSKLNEITDEELRTFHHTIREHFAPLMVATQNDRDSLAESRGFVKRFFNDYNNLFSLKEYNPDLMNIDLLRILYYRLLWFIAHCQWKYRRDDKLTIARKAECHLKRLMVFKFGIEESDLVTSVSQSLAEQTKTIIETDKEIIPIYNFVREKEFPTQHEDKYKELYGIKPEEKVLIHVSNFRRVKRIDTILETFAQVHEHVPSKLILLGDGPELLDMRKKARTLHIEDDVLFLGKQDQVSKFYQMADLVLLLSEKESFGLTLLEAMTTGVVPIGSNAGGIKEVIKHGETGYIVDVGDSEQASHYALKLLTDEQLYQKLQSNMLKDIKQRFSSELIVDQYEYYYKKMLN